jgi:gas vesicle protein
MGKLKLLGVSLLMAGAAILGDSCHINDKFVNPIKYRNAKIEPTTYQQPFKLQKKYTLNEKGMLEVHIGHGEKWHKVSNELRANERSLEQMLKDQGNEIAKSIKEKYEQKQPVIKEYMNKIIETYKEIFKGE